eukprot:scaffold3795_cov58-Attheya_sp.AAC.1
MYYRLLWTGPLQGLYGYSVVKVPCEALHEASADSIKKQFNRKHQSDVRTLDKTSGKRRRCWKCVNTKNYPFIV